jgi:hypothetical protein
MRRQFGWIAGVAAAAALAAPGAAVAAGTSLGTVAFDGTGTYWQQTDNTFGYGMLTSLCAPQCTWLSLRGTGRWESFLGPRNTILITGPGSVIFNGEYVSFDYELALVGVGPVDWTIPGVAQGYFVGSGTTAAGRPVTVGGSATARMAGPGEVRTMELTGSLSFAGATP